MDKKKYLECAIVINTHGVRGDVKLESLCDTPAVLAGLKRVYFYEGGEYQEAKVLHSSVFKSFVLFAVYCYRNYVHSGTAFHKISSLIFVSSHRAPDVKDHEVALGGHTLEGDVACCKDVTAILTAVF